MPEALYPVCGTEPRRLAIAARPRGGDWLLDDLTALRRAGVEVLVSLLEPAEARELGLAEEADLCARVGIEFVSLPVPDYGLPDSALRFAAKLRPLAFDGRFIAAHCRAGIGRSPLLIGCLLVLRGVEPEEAWRRLAEARGRPVPDTEAQRAWLAAFQRVVG